MSANSSNSSLHFQIYYCIDSRVQIIIFSAFVITKILLLLPISILIFYLGHQRWRHQSHATTSHSDVFTYHQIAIELFSFVLFIFFYYGAYNDLLMMAKVTYILSNMVFIGEMLFHVLTCVERYLAVVHPVTYVGLRQSGGVRMRNISIVCVWLLCFGWSGLIALCDPDFPTVPFFIVLVLSLIVVSFCSFCVILVLIRPGPGEVGGDEQRVDQSKQRAFHTVVAILSVLWLWFVWVILAVALEKSQLFSHSDGCLAMLSGLWVCLPSSLVLPLLFLKRAGKPQNCCYSNE